MPNIPMANIAEVAGSGIAGTAAAPKNVSGLPADMPNVAESPTRLKPKSPVKAEDCANVTSALSKPNKNPELPVPVAVLSKLIGLKAPD